MFPVGWVLIRKMVLQWSKSTQYLLSSSVFQDRVRIVLSCFNLQFGHEACTFTHNCIVRHTVHQSTITDFKNSTVLVYMILLIKGHPWSRWVQFCLLSAVTFISMTTL